MRFRSAMAARRRACSSVALARRDSAAAKASRRALRRVMRARSFGSMMESSRSMAKLYRVGRGVQGVARVVPRNARTSVVGRDKLPNGQMAKWPKKGERHDSQGSSWAWEGKGVARGRPPTFRSARTSLQPAAARKRLRRLTFQGLSLAFGSLGPWQRSIALTGEEVKKRGGKERHDSRGSSWAWKGE